jgi:transcriptional/translational regulatory protein YebC/TACO1
MNRMIAGTPKALIDAAIERGQGRSADGAKLESVTVEAIMPPGIALIIDIETDSKGRTLQDVKSLLKKHGGTTSSTTFFFQRLGRIVFETNSGGPGLDEIMDCAIEAGAEDLETDEDGRIAVWTQPSDTTAVAQAITGAFDMTVVSSGIIWSAHEDTKVRIDSSDSANLFRDLLTGLRDLSEVQATYANATQGDLADEAWSKIDENLDS